MKFLERLSPLAEDPRRVASVGFDGDPLRDDRDRLAAMRNRFRQLIESQSEPRTHAAHRAGALELQSLE